MSRRPDDGDAALLALEIGTVWSTDDRGRLCGSVGPWPQLVLALGADGRTVAVGSDVPDPLADELRLAALGGVGAVPAGHPPPELDDCVRLLSRLGAVSVTSGPSFVVPAGVASASPFEVTIRRSSGGDENLGPLRPAPWWEPDEWRDLLVGELGPWAMSVEDGQVTALCHSARLTERAAEAGVWTHPDFRRQGRASAVTAAWAAHPGLGDRVRFYSTSTDNAASQGVAAGLGLRLIGWMWKVSVDRATA